MEEEVDILQLQAEMASKADEASQCHNVSP